MTEEYSVGYTDGYQEGWNAAQEENQEVVAIHQYRVPHCSDWYDGIPDHHDGHGPYEVRTLYTAPQKREWVGLTLTDLVQLHVQFGYKCKPSVIALEVEKILKEKNT